MIGHHSANIQVFDNIFAGNLTAKGSGSTRAFYVYDGRRDPEPINDVSIDDNTLNGDRIQRCTITGMSCARNTTSTQPVVNNLGGSHTYSGPHDAA